VRRKDQQFSLLHRPSSRAPLRPDTESSLLSPSSCARARATIDTSRKKNSRAKVCIRARSEEMREERARYLAAERRGKGLEGTSSRLRNPPTRSASPKSQGSRQGCTVECTVSKCSRYNPRRAFLSISANLSPRDSMIVASI